MLEKLLSLLVCSTFVVDVSGSQFLFLSVVHVLVWLTCLVSTISIPPPSHSGTSVIVW